MDKFILAVLPPFLLLLIGCFARRMDWLSGEADKSLSRFIIHILYPCFIVYHVLGTKSPIGLKEADFEYMDFLPYLLVS